MTTEPLAGLAWEVAIDALSFRPRGHDGHCVVHRRAFRVLVGGAADPGLCLAFARDHASALEAAAAGRIAARGLPAGARFHLTSREIRRALSGAPGLAGEAVQEETREGAQQGP